MQKVLILGAGLVANPIVQYLLQKGYHLTLADQNLERARELINHHENGKAAHWETSMTDELDELISSHDICVSLLPWMFHVMVAGRCIALGKNMLTSSYVKPEMQALDAEAKKAGIIILNELGLDPGLDHMSAMRIIDHVHQKGGKVEKFYSLCGALPAPEASDNPFRYKFSWSPKGVILASNNSARYLFDGKEINTPTTELFKDIFSLNFPPVGKLEVYPNRDSIEYIDIYGIPEARTVFRGTFRYPGWCEALDAMKKCGLTSAETMDVAGKSYAGFLAGLIKSSAHNLKTDLASFLNTSTESTAIKAIEWLGLLSDTPMMRSQDSPFEITSDLMIEKMSLQKHERDMVVMQHSFLVSYPDGSKEVIRSRMLDYGSPGGDTSVARTVALPAAMGVEMILQKKISLKGVYRPVVPEIYNPVLDALEHLGIRMEEEYGLGENEMIKR